MNTTRFSSPMQVRPAVQLPGLYDYVAPNMAQRNLLFLVVHVPLVFAIKSNPWIATAHAVATLSFGLLTTLEARAASRILPVLGYIVVSESLWRVGRAKIFYESAKYALAGLAILALLRFSAKRKLVLTPALYFSLLVPSIAVMPAFDREHISFNLSGPLSLAMATLFLSRVSITHGTLRKTITAIMGPIVGLATVASVSTLTTENIDFYSTKVASGGLGQNQASSLFGLGALVCFLYLSLLRRSRPLPWLFSALGIWCAGQSVLTFSRGGMATAIGAATIAIVFLSSDRRFRGIVVLRVVLVSVVAVLFLVPILTSITSGLVKQRFTSTDLTGRDRIMEADLAAFRENPILGVGPGQSEEYHIRTTMKRTSAHTEYTRLLAEHGMLGATGLLLLLVMSFRWVKQQATLRSKAFSAALVTWSLLYMFHAAMRMALVSFIFALASTRLLEPPQTHSVRRRDAGTFGPHART